MLLKCFKGFFVLMKHSHESWNDYSITLPVVLILMLLYWNWSKSLFIWGWTIDWIDWLNSVLRRIGNIIFQPYKSGNYLYTEVNEVDHKSDTLSLVLFLSVFLSNSWKIYEMLTILNNSMHISIKTILYFLWSLFNYFYSISTTFRHH